MSILKTLLVRLGGAPDRQPEAYYKDLVLSLVAAFAFLVITVLLANRRLTVVLLIAVVVLSVAIVLATKRLFVIGIAAGIACMRFVVAFLFAPSLTSFGAAVLLALFVLALYLKIGDDWYDRPGDA